MECIFCRIAQKELPAKIVFEDDDLVAFHDINPIAEHHVLVIPKKHIGDVRDLTESDDRVAGTMLRSASKVARTLGFLDDGFQLLIRNGQSAGQEIMHLHMHVISGRKF